MNGLEHINQTFADLRAQKRAALMPYFTLGFPNPAASVDVIEALAKAGADLIELGVPFSDPLADGPTIQHSTQIALDQGMTVRLSFELVRQIRARGVQQPLLLMGYINPLLAYGIERYVAEACSSGADGLIVPDLPMEEASALEAACRASGLALVYLVSPASTPERIAALAARTSGFLYLVSLTGVTGARDALSAGLGDFIDHVRPVARTPLAVGFGISTPQQAQAVANMADGVIIGSALVSAVIKASKAAAEAKPTTDSTNEVISAAAAAAATDYLRAIRAALEPVAPV